jgi:hypothetical protein
MKRSGRARPKAAAASAAAVPFLLLALAALPRLAGLSYGLPHVYNADEPHVLNMAVSLAGSLRPFSFKYPTLWPTALAAAYGLWFALWSGFGLLRGAGEFAALYAFRPTGFYLIARGLAAACQLGALYLVARLEREDEARWPYGAALLALAPTLVELAHAAKPDSFMFLLSAGAVLAALRFQKNGERRWLLGCALLAGLACSAQYTAAPAGLVVPLAWLLGDEGPAPPSWLLQAALVSALGFWIGTPYALIDHARFLADWSDYADLGRLRAHEAAQTGLLVAKNVWCFAGEGTLGGAAAALGAGLLLRRAPKRALLLLVPVAVYGALLAASFDGGVPRYLLGAFVPLALLAGEGFSWLAGKPAWRRGAVAALALAPGLWLSARMDAEFLSSDTRAQAGEWLAANVPAGETLLLDQPHAGPFAVMAKEQCEELAARTESAGSPRARLFRAMAAHHPGGGWRIERIRRSPADLWSAPRHVALSQADGDFLDVRPGLDVARAARVDYVITSSFGADPRRARELATFFAELAAGADLVQEFRPVPGEVVGPWLRVYRLKR